MAASSAAAGGALDAVAASRAARVKLVSDPTVAYNRGRHLDRILETRNIHHVFQPIVHLDGREVVAYEALTRGPEGSPLESPADLFGTARDCNLVSELDWVSRATAMETAMGAGFGSTLTLFVNIEPDVAATRAPDDLHFIVKNAQRDLRVVLEITERSLMARPADLLHWLSFAREQWWGVALDDVGATADSLALMPFIRPDIIKLDSHFVRDEELTGEDERSLAAIFDYVDRTGALVVAEGIETKAHLVRAKEQLRADLGQGWYFGRPSPLPRSLPMPTRAVPLLEPADTAPHTSPWEMITGSRPVDRLPEASVARRFAQVEQAAIASREAPVVLGCVPRTPGPWSDHVAAFTRVGTAACFAGVVGAGLERLDHDVFQQRPLERGSDMADEWVLVTISPHNAAAVVARQTQKTDAGGQRVYECAWTQDPQAVAPIAELLMKQLSTPAIDLGGRLTL